MAHRVIPEWDAPLEAHTAPDAISDEGPLAYYAVIWSFSPGTRHAKVCANSLLDAYDQAVAYIPENHATGVRVVHLGSSRSVVGFPHAGAARSMRWKGPSTLSSSYRKVVRDVMGDPTVCPD